MSIGALLAARHYLTPWFYCTTVCSLHLRIQLSLLTHKARAISKNFDANTLKHAYSCDGKTCNDCPAETLATPGALSLSECVSVAKLTILLKGPMRGNPVPSRQVTQVEGFRRPFDFELFQVRPCDSWLVLGRVTAR
jgi:hypothetical protein